MGDHGWRLAGGKHIDDKRGVGIGSHMEEGTSWDKARVCRSKILLQAGMPDATIVAQMWCGPITTLGVTCPVEAVDEEFME